MRLFAAAFAALLLIVPACAAGQTAGRAGNMAIPPTPAPVRDILYSRPFTLGKLYRNDWSKERPMVSAGGLGVPRGDPGLGVSPRTPEPVLLRRDRNGP